MFSIASEWIFSEKYLIENSVVTATEIDVTRKNEINNLLLKVIRLNIEYSPTYIKRLV
jgi:hypothetical protein